MRTDLNIFFNRYSVFLIVFFLSFSVLAEDILILGLFKGMVILRIDDVQHKLRTGDVSPEGIKLVSANSEEAVLEIRGQRQSFSLGSHTRTSNVPSRQTLSEARIWSNRGMYTTPGSINGLPVNFLVDTGATWVAMNAAQAKRLGINYRYEGKKGYASTASGVAQTYVVNLKSVKVGDIELQQVKGAVIEGPGPDTVLLGMSFLNQVKMQRDGKFMLLQKRN